jgi:hypothetical protein
MDTPLFRKLDDPSTEPLTLSLTIDGQSVNADPGDSVAAALLCLSPPLSRTTPVKGGSRAPYCMMGVCFECLATVDGVASTQTCLVEVKQGMCVERQHGRRQLAICCLHDESGFQAEALERAVSA